MRQVKRLSTAGPQSLLVPGRAGASELERARAHFGPPPQPGTFTFRAYKGDDVRHALEALFHGKCAYCETRYDTSGPVDIEHFRPKGGVEGIAHCGYWWLAGEWTNLLPSCLDCNRRRYQATPTAFASLSAGLDGARSSGFLHIKTGKETCFPIAQDGVRIVSEPETNLAAAAIEAERALLLDPCRDDPSLHLRFHIDRSNPVGLVYPAGSGEIALPVLPDATDRVEKIEKAAREAGVSVRGAVSIQVYGLNRLALVQERTRLQRRLEFLGGIVIEMSAVADSLANLTISGQEEQKVLAFAIKRTRASANRALAEIRAMARPEASFSSMVRAWIETFVADLRSKRVPAQTVTQPRASRPAGAARPRGVSKTSHRKAGSEH